jgi:RNA polymerase sigma-70 factor (ECF subfamily)
MALLNLQEFLNAREGARHPRALQVAENVSRCLAGDEASWRELYAAHFNFAWRVARRLGTPQSDLEDTAQEAFEVAFKRLGDFREGRFRTWLFRIVANVVSSRHRARRVRELFLGVWGHYWDGSDDSLAPRVEARETLGHVQQILARMAPKKREVFALCELEGLPHSEVAELVGCSVDTVRTRLFHARRDFEKACRKRGVHP